jgi:ketosteroid isomerase-like protein
MDVHTLTVFLLFLVVVAPMAQSQTVYDPSPTDPRIVGALESERRMERAGASSDFDAMAAVFAPDLVVNSPINMVVMRDNVLARMRGGQIAYEATFTRTIDFVGVRGDAVVVMGEEVVVPVGDAPAAGKTVHRRFTDIWRTYDGVWRLTIRQATITSAR